MGTNQDAVQRTEVLGVAVICTLLYGALDALIGIAIHVFSPPLIDFGNSMARMRKNMTGISYYLKFLCEKTHCFFRW